MNNIKTNESVSFITAANNWRQKLRSSKLSPKTIKTYESIIDSQLLPRLSNYRLSEISGADLERFINYYRKTSITPAYVKMIKRIMLSIVNSIGQENYVTKKSVSRLSNTNTEKISAFPTEAQAKLETGIRENDASVLMTILMRENISMSKLLALSIDDVNQVECEVTFRQRMILNGNKFELVRLDKAQKVTISRTSMELLATELRKHSILSSKKRYSYSNPERLIFTDINGNIYKPSYYVCKFKQLSKITGFHVTPKLLSEFVYVERAANALNESECKQVTVKNNGKEYHYVKATVKTKSGKHAILARSIDQLREKYLTHKTPYSFSETKSNTKFSVLCHDELHNLKNLREDERNKLDLMLQKYLNEFCERENITVNQVDDNFRAKFMEHLKDKHCKFSTREQLTEFLRNVCNKAIKKNFIRYNPFMKLSLEADPIIKYHALNDKEITKIMKLDSEDINNAFLQVKLLTGTRTAEALGLCWNDILNDKQILIRHQLKANNIIKTTKSYKPRKITPPSLAFEILEKVRAKTFSNVKNNLRLIFCNEDGSPLNAKLLHEKLRMTIGRHNARLHDLRVTAITTLYKTTNNLTLAAREAGHSNTDITVKHYVDVVPNLGEAKIAQDNYYEGLKNEAKEKIIS